MGWLEADDGPFGNEASSGATAEDGAEGFNGLLDPRFVILKGSSWELGFRVDDALGAVDEAGLFDPVDVNL